MSTGLASAIAVSGAVFMGWLLAAGVTGNATNGGHPPPQRGVGADHRRRGFRILAGRLLRRPKPPEPAQELQRAALLVGQLAALLRAGRRPEQLWEQAFLGLSEQSGSLGESDDPWGRVLRAAGRAAALGRPAASAIREAVAAEPVPGAARMSAAAAGAWLSVAACIETAEASGSPLAGVLDRLAGQLEADADAAAARAVALAGPRATASVLSVLPIAGLGLGFLMGADPTGVLLSTPLGVWCLGLGCALTLAGRWWSSRLVRAASETR